MPSTVRPVAASADLERLRRFHTELLGAGQTQRVPDDGPVFHLGLRIGNSDLGLVQDDAAADAPAGRILLSVDDVAALLPRVVPLGGTVTGGPTDMPWGQRVLHVRDADGNPVDLTQSLVSSP